MLKRILIGSMLVFSIAMLSGCGKEESPADKLKNDVNTTVKDAGDKAGAAVEDIKKETEK